MERHLIRPHTTTQGSIDAVDYLAQLRAVHDAIVARAVSWTVAGAGPSWGIRAKRSGVDLSGAHPLISNEAHPITELMNISATVERLLDALGWAIQNEWAASVIECNPTTSSRPGPPDLRTVGERGEAWFEVSDVVSRRDGNRKLQTDLERLRRVPIHAARFLVGSPVWEERIRYRGFWYDEVPPEGTIVARIS
jgi:hypothetical protein